MDIKSITSQSILGQVKIHHDAVYQIDICVLWKKLTSKDIGKSVYLQSSLPLLDNPVLRTTCMSLLEAAIATLVVTRLGWSNSGHPIHIFTKHPLPTTSIPHLTNIINLFVGSRTLISGLRNRCGKIRWDNVTSSSSEDKFRSSENISVLAWSGGIDSTACLLALLDSDFVVQTNYFRYYGKGAGDCHDLFDAEETAIDSLVSAMGLKASKWSHRRSVCDLRPILSVPHNTYCDSLDLDPWELYGRNFLFTLLLEIEALYLGGRWLGLGLTAEDLFCTEKVIGCKSTYSECCQSVAFVSYFNKLMQAVLGANAPLCVTPLLNMRKGAVTQFLFVKNWRLPFCTRCCINNTSYEDGACFSCFDKFWAIMATVNPELLQVRLSEGYEQILLSYRDITTRFGWKQNRSLGNSNEIYSIPEISVLQCKRFLDEKNELSSDLRNSKFHFDAILAGLNNLRKRKDILENLFAGTLLERPDETVLNSSLNPLTETILNRYYGKGIPLQPSYKLVSLIDESVDTDFCIL
jgi:7-cyano-7-deazaguanine synthase in queuosine biosynthesis